MDEAFIIMQIGDDTLDGVCDQALVPAIEDAGFVPRRVDRHNEGDLLKSEIVQFIERSRIIVADLTNERPNCYLEIGYAMGLGKKSNLILTAREDHHHSSPNFDPNGSKVHFDLEGYDILFWTPDDLPRFRSELTERIKRRASIVRRNAPDNVLLDEADWTSSLQSRAKEGLAGVGRSGYMEVAAQLRPGGSWSQAELLDAVQSAEIHAFGWPIGIVLDNRDEYRPRPTTDGIVAEVAIDDGAHIRTSYDLWKLFRDGRFYTLLSLFEEEHQPDSIFWDTRTVRVAEALQFLVRLYRRLGASDNDQVTVTVRHGGLKDRRLAVANRSRYMSRDDVTTAEDVVESDISASIIELESNLVGYVKQVIDPLLVVFDFFEIGEGILKDVVEEFMAREPV